MKYFHLNITKPSYHTRKSQFNKRSCMQNQHTDKSLFRKQQELVAMSTLHSLNNEQYEESASNRQHNNYIQPSCSTNRIVVHCTSICTLCAIWGLLGYCFQYYVLPYISIVSSNTKNILEGSENGTTCSVWNHSPYQQAKCAIISHCSYLVSHFINSMYMDIQRMQSVSTGLAYLFSAVCGFYFFLERFRKSFLLPLYNINMKLYSKIVNTYENPYLPFNYIENAMNAVN